MPRSVAPKKDDIEDRVRRVMGYERAILFRRVTTYLNHVKGIVDLVERGLLPSYQAYEKALLAEEHALVTQVQRIATVTERNPVEVRIKE